MASGLSVAVPHTRCRSAGLDLIKRAMRELDGGGVTQARSDNAETQRCIFQEFVELAAHQTKEKRLNWSWPKEVDYKRFIVLLQNVLSNSARWRLLQSIEIPWKPPFPLPPIKAPLQ